MAARKKKPARLRDNTPQLANPGRWIPPTDTPAELYSLMGRIMNDLNNLVDHINPLMDEGCTITVYFVGGGWEEISAPISYITVHRS